MSEITAEQVAHLAYLARIDLSPLEITDLTHDLGQIVDSIAKVSEVATADTPATSHPMPLTNVFREDVVVPGLTPEEALAGAPEVEQQRFSVPRILGDEQ